jgi:hypothetical protein
MTLARAALPPWLRSARGFTAATGRPRGRVAAELNTTSQATESVIVDLTSLIRRYVVMSEEQLLVVALWVVHTHSIQHCEQTPYLSITSPERRCGKSRLLEVLELLVARPWNTVIPSEAVLYRNIHHKQPTLLLDEIDTIFNPRSADKYEGHRALLNAGHRRGSTVPRCVGTSLTVQEFRVFCAKVLAGIGTLPDTIADRSVPIRLKRRQKDEQVERSSARRSSRSRTRFEGGCRHGYRRTPTSSRRPNPRCRRLSTIGCKKVASAS